MSEVIRPWRWIFLSLVMALTGCAGMSEGPASVSNSPDPRLKPIQTAIQDECFANASARPRPDAPAPAATPEEMQIRRNNLVTAYMVAADLSYNDYERALLAFSRDNDLGSSLANQLVAAIGAASGSRALSRAMNITSGAVSGTQSAFAKSLLNQTVSVLQTHMRASRAAQFAIITPHLALPYASWNTCQALSEALAYEQAGTLNAALAAMEAAAADEERNSNADAQDAIQRITYTRDALSVGLRTYLRRGTAQRTTARAALTELIDEGTIPRPSYSIAQYLGEFQAGRGTPAQRAALARRIVQKENGSEAGTSLNEALP
jgi:hypothetical protein